MFNAQFISASNGISKKSERPWYMVELIASTVTGSAKVAKLFCTETAFNSARGLKPMQPCKVAGGVDDNGYLTVSNIKGE